jgi:hypothetical protein
VSEKLLDDLEELLTERRDVARKRMEKDTDRVKYAFDTGLVFAYESIRSHLVLARLGIDV